MEKHKIINGYLQVEKSIEVIGILGPYSVDHGHTVEFDVYSNKRFV